MITYPKPNAKPSCTLTFAMIRPCVRLGRIEFLCKNSTPSAASRGRLALLESFADRRRPSEPRSHGSTLPRNWAESCVDFLDGSVQELLFALGFVELSTLLCGQVASGLWHGSGGSLSGLTYLARLSGCYRTRTRIQMKGSGRGF